MKLFKRLLKWLGFTLLAIVCLVGIALGISYSYKSEIVAAVNQELKKNINGDFGIRDVDLSLWNDFPTLSITLKDIFVRGPEFERYKKDFLTASSVSVNVELGPLFHKKLVVQSIHIKKATIQVFRTHTGLTNLDVFKRQQSHDTTIKKDNSLLVFFKEVNFKDVQFLYSDSLKRKSFGFHFVDVEGAIAHTDSSGLYTLSGPMKFAGLEFNPDNGSFLKDKSAKVQFNLEFRPKTQNLVIRPSTMEFAKSNLDLSGDFYFAAPGKFVLTVGSPKLDYEEGISLLTRALREKLERITIDKPLNTTTILHGQFAPGSQPDVDIIFQYNESKTKAYHIEMDQVTLDGSFSNHADSTKPSGDRNSSIRLKRFAGIFQGLPTKLTASINDLKDPVLDLQSEISTDLRYFNSLVDTATLVVSKGKFVSHVMYTGKLNEYLDSSKTRFSGKVKGSVEIQDGAIRYVLRNQNYENIVARIDFSQDHLEARQISFLVNKSPVNIQGEGFGFIPFFSQPEKKGYVKLKLYSPNFDFASVTSKKSTRKSSAREKAMARKKISNVIDKLYEKLEFDLTIQMDKFALDKMRGTNMQGRVTLANNTLEAKDFTVGMADGTIGFSMSINNLHKEINPISVKAAVRNADIKKFFYSFNNFGLTALTYENLEGKITLDGRFWGAVDDNFTLWMPSLGGNAQFSVKNGALRNFEPLQSMSNFLFKKRDFANVYFGEIKSRMTIRATEIDIEKMEIESTVLRLFVEGRYSLKDSTSLELQVPLSNLKKRDKDYKPENVGVDSKVGPSIFLHVHKDVTGKTVIAYDPFKKYAKKAARKEQTSKKSKAS